MKDIAAGCALFLLAIMAVASSHAPVSREHLYFLAATSTWNRTDAYPANLYEAENGELKLVQEIVSSSEGVRFVRHYDGVLTIGSPHGLPSTLHLVDARSGAPSVSSMPFGFDTSEMTIQIIADSRQLGLSEAFELTSGNITGPVTRRSQVITLTSPLGLSDLIKNPPPSVWGDLRVSGSTGGPLDQGDNANCTIRDGNVAYPSPGRMISLAPVPAGPRTGSEEYCTVAGSNGRFLVYILLFRSFEEGIAAREKTFEVYDRVKHRTGRVVVQGSFSRVMLDDKWLIAITVEPNLDHKVNPGMEGIAGGEGSKLTPSVPELFASTEPPQYFPGICVLRDLERGAVFTLKTGQADTEILGVVNGKVIYRVNRQILIGELQGSGVENSKVIAQGDKVPAIHWLIKVSS